jgi:hypothetical protein
MVEMNGTLVEMNGTPEIEQGTENRTSQEGWLAPALATARQAALPDLFIQVTCSFASFKVERARI